MGAGRQEATATIQREMVVTQTRVIVTAGLHAAWDAINTAE
jgi:hypothetical protein